MPHILKVVCWNVNYPKFARNNTYVINTLEALDNPDVICLQEYVGGKDSQLLKWLADHNYETAYLPFAYRGSLSQGVMTATKKSLKSELETVVLRKDGPVRMRPFPNVRGLVNAHIKIGMSTLSVANFHSTYPRPHVRDMRKREFAELLKYLDKEESRNPILLCGDFNFFGKDYRKKVLLSRYKHFTGTFSNPTWRHRSRLSPISANLDYFFWKDLQVEANLLPFNTSDHRPLLAIVTL